MIAAKTPVRLRLIINPEYPSNHQNDDEENTFAIQRKSSNQQMMIKKQPSFAIQIKKFRIERINHQ